MFFEKYSARFTFPGAQNVLNRSCCTLSTSHQNLMSILLDFFGFTVLFIVTSAVLLSVLIGVPSGGFMCPSLISEFLIGTDYCVFMYNPPHSVSAADTITAFITLATMDIGLMKFLPSLFPK